MCIAIFLPSSSRSKHFTNKSSMPKYITVFLRSSLKDESTTNRSSLQKVHHSVTVIPMEGRIYQQQIVNAASV